MAWKRNEGRLPAECVVLSEDGNVESYRAVHVRLFGGFDTQRTGHAPWPAAGGRPPTDWSISRQPHPFQIREYQIA